MPLGPGPSSVHQALLRATGRLRSAGVDSPSLDAQLLLAFVLGWERARLWIERERELSPDELAAFRKLVERRAERTPLAHLTGEREFMGINFLVTPQVLVPRPETEILVEAVLARMGERAVGADAGTGSGCVAVALAAARPDWRIYATDASPQALAVAAENCRRHRVQQRVALLEGDLLEPVRERLDFAAANLPYVPTAELERLQPEVSRHEPKLALDGGPDGLAVIRRMVAQAPAHLRPGGLLALEVGQGQAGEVAELCRRAGFRDLEIIPDLAGIERVVIGRKPVGQERFRRTGACSCPGFA